MKNDLPPAWKFDFFFCGFCLALLMSYDYLTTGCTILNATALIHVIATPGSSQLYYHDSDVATARLNYYLPPTMSPGITSSSSVVGLSMNPHLIILVFYQFLQDYYLIHCIAIS